MKKIFFLFCFKKVFKKLLNNFWSKTMWLSILLYLYKWNKCIHWIVLEFYLGCGRGMVLFRIIGITSGSIHISWCCSHAFIACGWKNIFQKYINILFIHQNISVLIFLSVKYLWMHCIALKCTNFANSKYLCINVFTRVRLKFDYCRL